MFGWLKRLFGPPRAHFDVYRPSERLIFRYWDGDKVVQADPLVLWKRVMDRGPELAVMIKGSQAPIKNAAEEGASAVRLIRNAFGLKPLDDGFHVGNTLTDSECADLLDAFMEYCDTLKKNSPPLPTPVPPSAGSPTFSPAGPPTSSSSGSGSTATGSSTAPPTPSPTASVSPSAP